MAALFRPWLKMSPFCFKLGDRSRFAFVFRKEIFFSILVARQITAKWSRILVQTSSKRHNKTWDTSRLACDKNSFFFFIRVFFSYFFHTSPPRGSGQIAYNRPTLLAPDLTVINTEFVSQTTASICLTLFPHSLKRYFNCNTSISNFSPYQGKANFLVLDILGRAFLRTLGCTKTSLVPRLVCRAEAGRCWIMDRHNN